MLSAIQVIEHCFSEIVIRANEDCSEEASHSARYAVRAEKQEDPSERVWKIEMAYHFGRGEEDKTPPYEGHLKLHGYFLIHPDFPEEKCEFLARMNGGAVLMGAIRELVLNHTFRSVNGPLELPLVDARTFLPKDQQDAALVPKPAKEEAAGE